MADDFNILFDPVAATTTGPDLTDPYIRARLGMSPLPPNSLAAEQVSASAAAKSNNATTQHPALPPAFLDDPLTNVINPPTAPVQAAQTVQSAPITKRDDTGNTASSGNRALTQQLKSDMPDRIVSKDNILTTLANATYSISMYLLNADEFKALLHSKNKTIPSAQLLIQSGGINSTDSMGKTGRNEFFDVDFYIDQLKIAHLASPKGSGASTNSTTIEFKITEPNGITLLDRLHLAASKHCPNPNGARTSYQSQHYLIVIRFYGQDESGNAVGASQLGIEVGSEQASVVEKFFPITLTKIGFRIANNATEYSCTGVITGQLAGTGSATTVVQHQSEISGDSLDLMLSGTSPLGETAPPPNAATAPKTKFISQSLVSLLNKWETDLTPKAYNIPNKFEIVLHGDIKNAKMAKVGAKTKSQTPMTLDVALNSKAVSADLQGRKFSINAGTSILYLIDILVRSSTYITDQETLGFDEKTGTPIVKTPKNNSFRWYTISIVSEPIGFDEKRAGYAYKTTYNIHPYLVENLKSPYFPKGSYKGAHKIYNYWFTGQNTEVVSFEQQFDYLFFQPKSASGHDALGSTSNAREWERRIVQLRSSESSQGGANGSTEAAANMAHILYSPGDQAQIKLSILGDPDWIEQSESFYNPVTLTHINSDWLPDNSVNFTRRQPIFELRFNTPTDYNLKYNPSTGKSEVFDDGTMPVDAYNSAHSFASNEKNVAAQSQVYAATTITSLFAQGKFTQELQGVIMHFPTKDADVVREKPLAVAAAVPAGVPVTPSAIAAPTVVSTPPAKSILKQAAEANAKPNATPIAQGGNLHDNGLFAPAATGPESKHVAPVAPYDPSRPVKRLDTPTAYQQNITDSQNKWKNR
jgi:hypothetical protein